MSSKKFNEVSCIDILKSFFLLGLTSFGGPIAHIGFFRNTFVKEKKWLDDDTYMEFVSLCNFLPGPSSSQVGRFYDSICININVVWLFHYQF